MFKKTATRCVVSIPETNGNYSVCNDGTVLSYAQRDQGKPLKGAMTAAGYRSVGLYAEEGGKSQTHLVHRLVCRAFHGPPPSNEHTDVRHLDGDKANNCASNLAWGTRSENMRDVVRHRAEGVTSASLPVSDAPWYGGRTGDVALVQVCVDLLNEGRLQIVDVARLLSCSESVAFNLMRGRTGTHALTAQQPGKKKRTLKRKEQIYALISEGRSRTEVNALLSETLSAQDFYYYSQVHATRTRERKA